MPTSHSTPPRTAPDDDALVWELAAAARPHIHRSEADRIHIAIGVGETFTAIEALLTAIVRDHIPLGKDLVGAMVTWLDCYRGHDAAPRLRQLLAEITPIQPQHMSAFEQRFGSAASAGNDPHRRSE